MADSIIQLNKTKLLKSAALTVDTTATVVFATESDAVRLSVYVPTLIGTFWWELYELGGSVAGHEKLVHRSETYKGPMDPVDFTTSGGQLFKLILHSTGQASYHIFATGINGSLALLANELAVAEQAIQPGLQNDGIYRHEVISHLNQHSELLTKILNHLRLVTEINGDKGRTFNEGHPNEIQ